MGGGFGSIQENSTTSIQAPPQQKSFTANLPLPQELCHGNNIKRGFQMKGMQLPLVSNTATTGHKLQGSKVVNIFVLDWNYTTNLPYVVLSRVTTMRGLFFRKKLQRAHACAAKYKELMAIMRQKSAQIFAMYGESWKIWLDRRWWLQEIGFNVYCNQHKNHYLYFLCNTYITASNKSQQRITATYLLPLVPQVNQISAIEKRVSVIRKWQKHTWRQI